ncbi:MAG: NADH-quinone oxidoreductase subunit D [Nitrospirae bacterium]|nr:MAG: NADH-quinone oxidoreductase subunit D [Nitrospirota bacterium]
MSPTAERPLTTRSMMLNLGPSHPAMHGVVRFILELDGEQIIHADTEIGYLHRGFEKMSEQGNYLTVIPYTDRLNYVSPPINNHGYCLAVEKLMGITVPERGEYIRVILDELARVADHLTCIGAAAMELGAFTAFLYMMEAREMIYDCLESVTGARLTVSFCRIGGVKADLPEGFSDRCHRAFARTREILTECDKLLTRNRIFVDRMRDVGVLSKERTLAYGIQGPFARANGVDWDLRRDQPYSIYDRVEFEVPVGDGHCDNYERYVVRMIETEQSMRIVEQCLEQIPKKGPVAVDEEGRELTGAELVEAAKRGRTEGVKELRVVADPTLDGTHRGEIEQVTCPDKHVLLPPKEETYGSIEGLINHFKLVMTGHGIAPPAGEAYGVVEGANGELGFYVVSDGTDRPYRVRCHPPCFPILAAMGEILEGHMVADVTPIFGMVNMIAGELDR